ncbi:hypothetical protein [Ruminobacter sp. RM87]|uniref:hypothetical protein n=1 Tax=Ruminobacter sp. RM87 TaxID=1200567 RepID=UPI0004E1E136|nr:hypothetical protein [Ruminobacter sp. RM87]
MNAAGGITPALAVFGLFVIMGIHNGLKGNKFFNISYLITVGIILLLLCISFGYSLSCYYDEIGQGLTVTDTPEKSGHDFGMSLIGLVSLSIVYAVPYTFFYLIKGRRVKYR